MFRCKTTITRPDRDRLRRATQSNTNLLRWGLFIDELQREIDRARVIDPARVPPDVVTMHSTVRICDINRDTPEVYTLVYPEDSAPRHGRVSMFTPVGTALLGRRVGDVVRVATGDGVRPIAVEAILYQPEAAQATRLARTRAALRRARRGELVMVYVLAALVSLVMLPAVIAAVAIWGAVLLWQNLREQWRWTPRDRGLLAVRRARSNTFGGAGPQPRRRGRHQVGSTRRALHSERHRRASGRCSATRAGEGVSR
jgi:regulator of nucleoside diphosphate kinase